jgi:anaphase-promoting complex subunit 6
MSSIVSQTALAAVSTLPPASLVAWQGTLLNLGHSFRKLRRYDAAVSAFERALALQPGAPATLTALGLTLHLQGKLDAAIR